MSTDDEQREYEQWVLANDPKSLTADLIRLNRAWQEFVTVFVRGLTRSALGRFLERRFGIVWKERFR